VIKVPCVESIYRVINLTIAIFSDRIIQEYIDIIGLADYNLIRIMEGNSLIEVLVFGVDIGFQATRKLGGCTCCDRNCSQV